MLFTEENFVDVNEYGKQINSLLKSYTEKELTNKQALVHFYELKIIIADWFKNFIDLGNRPKYENIYWFKFARLTSMHCMYLGITFCQCGSYEMAYRLLMSSGLVYPYQQHPNEEDYIEFINKIVYLSEESLSREGIVPKGSLRDIFLKEKTVEDCLKQYSLHIEVGYIPSSKLVEEQKKRE